jgi:hypothetical protein
MLNLTTEQFVEKAKAVHGDKYNYTNTIYTRSRDRIEIECPTHGVISIVAAEHLKGQGCKECNKLKYSLEEFKERAKLIHGDKFDYSNAEYRGFNKKVKIFCNQCHTWFEQTPVVHINGKAGCKKCKYIEIALKYSFKKHKKGSNGYVNISIPRKEIHKYIIPVPPVRVDTIKKRRYKVNLIVIGEHTYVMAKHLGRPIITTKEEVHHKDGDRSNNKISNLGLRQKGHGAGHTHEEKLESNAYYVLDHINELAPSLKRKLIVALGV